MTINGRKVKLKKSIRRVIEVIKMAAVISVLSYGMIVLFFWAIGIDLIG